MGYETGIYAGSSFPCYRANGVDNLRAAINVATNVLVSAGWTKTGAIPAWGNIKLVLGAPFSNPAATTPQPPIYYVGIVSSADQTLYSYFFVDTANPPTSVQWSNALLYANPVGTIVQVPLGTTSNNSLANLLPGLMGWTGTLSGSGSGLQLNLVATNPGIYGNTMLPDMFTGSYWVSPDIQPAGGGYSVQSQVLPSNKPVNVNVIEQPSVLANYTVQFQFPDFGLNYSLAQSTFYNMWASPVAFCVFENQDVPSPPPSAPPDVNLGSNTVFVSQIYLDTSAYPTTAPMQLLIGGPNRIGLASTHSDPTSTVATWTPEGVFSATSVSGINPIWACYVPRFAETAATLARVNGTPVTVDAVMGLTRATSSAPSRIRGLLPDGFVLLDDRNLDEQIKCGGKTWWAMRAGHTSFGGNAPAGTLYMRTA